MIIDPAQHYKEQVSDLLAAQNLPVADLPEVLNNFLVAIMDSKVVGVAGVEIYGSYGLLRSLAVEPEYRNSGIAAKLVSHIESLGRLKGLSAVYLLTETASEYFERKGFEPIERTAVP